MRTIPGLLLVLSLTACPAGGSGGAPVVSTITTAQLDSARRSPTGRVRLVNVWATWCRPCMDEIPALVRIREEFAPSGVELTMVSTDDPDDLDSLVVPTLRRLGVEFETYILDDDADRFIRVMHPDWSGALPASFIYDRDGSLAGWFYGERSYESFAEELRGLIDE